jgi:hypothetical protein
MVLVRVDGPHVGALAAAGRHDSRESDDHHKTHRDHNEPAHRPAPLSDPGMVAL